MHASTLLLPLLPLLSTTLAAPPAFTGPAFIVPTLTTWNSTLGNFSIAFYVTDPVNVAPISTQCGASWNGTDFPSKWVSCKDNSVDFRFNAFNDIANFSLAVKHTFSDPCAGKPPKDKVTTFAKTKFTVKNTLCTATYCTLKENEQVLLPVVASIL